MNILYVVNNLRSCNGVTTVLMSQYDAVIENGHSVDFLQIAHQKNVYIEKINKNGGNIYTMPTTRLKIEKIAFNFLDDLFSSKKYNLVHVNISDLYAVLILRAAKKHNTKNIVYHSHNPKLVYNKKIKLRTYIYDWLCVHYANHYAACSVSAGKSIFGRRKFTVLHNVLDASKYQYDECERRTIRNKLGISDTDIVIGSVGRYAEQKNPLFALEIFLELCKKNPTIKYIWVGSGGIYENVMREKSKDMDNFFMVGSQENANKWYSAFDIFLLPSIFEGFGNVLIEAQASGLSTVTSDVVPRETSITELIHYLKLSDGVSAWVDCIQTIIDSGVTARKSRIDDIIKSGYDSLHNNREFIDYYNRFE